VIDGERNLTERMAARFAVGRGLDDEEAEFFVDHVAFAQAKTAKEKAACYRKLTGSRRYRSGHELEVAQADYHSKWYLPAIRELVAREGFDDDPEWIASRLRPRIDAAEGLALLLRIGLLVRSPDGIAQGELLVSTGPEAAGVTNRAHDRESDEAEIAWQAPPQHRSSGESMVSAWLTGCLRLPNPFEDRNQPCRSEWYRSP
tara:strand:+ start:1308 stop:1913 length:606 start_codon:yes stop_codon:yes gene_type:complete